MRLTRRAAILIFACGLCPAFAGALHAQEAAPSDPLEQLRILKKYGATHKACDGWSDGCAVCARRSDGSLGCSRLGVDCDITPIVCTQAARDPKTGKTPAPQPQ